MIIVVMGPAGAGKTVVGRALAEAMGWPFADADDLHDEAARRKMAAGQALDDADRAPWLHRVRQRMAELGQGVIACSALRVAHRDVLQMPEVRFVLLEADEATLRQRVAARPGHFMPPSLVASQIVTLERSPDLVSVDATMPIGEIVAAVRARLGLTATAKATTVLVTGLGGTVGHALAARLARDGARVVGWDRARVAIDHYDAMLRFVEATAPDVVVNLAIASAPTGRAQEGWLVNYEWPSELAWITRQLGVRFVHASSVMVFSGEATGPFDAGSLPDATEGYGHEKRRAEQRVIEQNPDATIVRLGWQIGDRPGGNQMIDFLEREMRAHGEITASTRWRPACSFLDDTADAIARLLAAAPDRYLLDSNTRWSFHDIVQALAAHHGDRWRVVATDVPTQDQRMIDPRAGMPGLDARLPGLP